MCSAANTRKPPPPPVTPPPVDLCVAPRYNPSENTWRAGPATTGTFVHHNFNCAYSTAAGIVMFAGLLTRENTGQPYDLNHVRAAAPHTDLYHRRSFHCRLPCASCSTLTVPSRVPWVVPWRPPLRRPPPPCRRRPSRAPFPCAQCASSPGRLLPEHHLPGRGPLAVDTHPRAPRPAGGCQLLRTQRGGGRRLGRAPPLCPGGVPWQLWHKRLHSVLQRGVSRKRGPGAAVCATNASAGALVSQGNATAVLLLLPLLLMLLLLLLLMLLLLLL